MFTFLKVALLATHIQICELVVFIKVNTMYYMQEMTRQKTKGNHKS